MIFNGGTDNTKELQDSIAQLNENIGDLSDLPTTDKSSAVSAITELNENKVETSTFESGMAGKVNIAELVDRTTGSPQVVLTNKWNTLPEQYEGLVTITTNIYRFTALVQKNTNLYGSAVIYGYGSFPIYQILYNGVWESENIVKRIKSYQLEMALTSGALAIRGISLYSPNESVVWFQATYKNNVYGYSYTVQHQTDGVNIYVRTGSGEIPPDGTLIVGTLFNMTI